MTGATMSRGREVSSYRIIIIILERVRVSFGKFRSS